MLVLLTQSVCLCAGGSLPEDIAKSLRKLEELSWWAATLNTNYSNPTDSNLLRVLQFLPAGQAGQSCASQKHWPIVPAHLPLWNISYSAISFGKGSFEKEQWTENLGFGSNNLILSQFFYSIEPLKMLSCSGQRFIHNTWLDFPCTPASPKTTESTHTCCWGQSSVLFHSLKPHWDKRLCFPTATHLAADNFKCIKYLY